MNVLNNNQDALTVNNSYAAVNRQIFNDKQNFVINVIGSPGAGKTSLLEKIMIYLSNHLKSAVIEGDLATAKDAARMAACQVPVVQINTNGGGRLDAKMINQVLSGFHLDYLDMLIIENVGNLVCPATYDLGEDMKLLVMSLPEGGDKPAKYPTAFLSSQAVILNKMDLSPFVNVDVSEMKKDILHINPNIRIFETSCRQGYVEGIEELAQYLVDLAQKKRSGLNKENL